MILTGETEELGEKLVLNHFISQGYFQTPVPYSRGNVTV
jgi:hypothetical protein